LFNEIEYLAVIKLLMGTHYLSMINFARVCMYRAGLGVGHLLMIPVQIIWEAVPITDLLSSLCNGENIHNTLATTKLGTL
jgi:hypothetical protein